MGGLSRGSARYNTTLGSPVLLVKRLDEVAKLRVALYLSWNFFLEVFDIWNKFPLLMEHFPGTLFVHIVRLVTIIVWTIQQNTAMGAKPQSQQMILRLIELRKMGFNLSVKNAANAEVGGIKEPLREHEPVVLGAT